MPDADTLNAIANTLTPIWLIALAWTVWELRKARKINAGVARWLAKIVKSDEFIAFLDASDAHERGEQ